MTCPPDGCVGGCAICAQDSANRSAVNHTPLGDAPPMKRWLVEEKKAQRWAMTVPARSADEARRMARECGFVDAATCREVEP